MKQKNTDLTQGSIGWKLLLFALPLLGSSLIQQLYNTVDLMFVGNLLGKGASAAVGTCGWPINCLVGFFTGMGVGVGVLVSQACGAKDSKKVKQIIHTTMGLVLAGSVILMVIGMTLAPVILRKMNTPEDILELAVTYARIYFLSMFSILGYNFSSGILRALGNSRSPMIYQLLGGIANVFGNALFIYVLDLGVAGAALATFCSQTVAAALTIRHLCRLPEEYRLNLRRITLRMDVLKRIFTVGVPMGVQTTLVSVSLLLLQSQINTMGVTSMAAYTAYSKMESFVYFPMWAVGQATTTFVGQNLGSGQIQRAEKGTKTALLLGIGITVVITLTLTAFSQTALHLFSNEADVIELGSRIIVRLFPLYFIYVFVEVLSGAIRGAGKAAPVMMIILVNMFAVRLVFLYIAMMLFDTVYEVALIFPATWITTALSVGIYYLTGRWKQGWCERKTVTAE
ncbi:MATE family efflux transporter [Butyricicoccus sp.]|uniref:MATE family efflux transporter n=1 Tax=Butyricicoccus sp. TaxID=2049021 RepID=UPI003F16B37B